MTDTAVLVTTKHRGVFFGYKKSEEGNYIVLTRARCAIKFATTKGFLELASVGPNSKSKIGAVADQISLYDVTSVTNCTEDAEKAWNAAQ